jgi:hypothetical protein
MTISQQQRQSQLFAAEDWQVLYTAFSKVNFSSYDFNTIRAAMINYIRLTYPEDFNDWIESSEFVAIIDMLAYLGQSLAFRMDLNTRENFLDTAQRRESIFRLAKMLNYQPKRAIPSQGLLKVTQVTCNQDIYDANGTNLNGSTITWNDLNNPDWFEQFVLVLNSALDTNNPYGSPSSSGFVGNIETQLYRMNNTLIPTGVIPFTATVGGNNMSFELCNPDFSTTNAVTGITNNYGYFYEKSPNPLNSWNLIYRSDGNGYNSANTGFFLMFKQGTLGYNDYRLDYQIANRIIDIPVNNINETDIWVQGIDINGLVTQEWTRVPSVNGFNAIYNSLDKSVRNIYSVVSRDAAGNDQISIRFADGNFGNAPLGLIRVWYRTSNGLQYQIRPTDMANLNFSFSYNDRLNNVYSMLFGVSLQYTVANSQTRQSNDQIKLNASQVYYTQDRMVNGEDYNLYPLQSSQALKVKAVNRTYSGHNRYLDLNDPTGNYQNINVFSQDGILYSESNLNRQDIQSNSLNATAIVLTYLQPLIAGTTTSYEIALELRDFFYEFFPRYSPTMLVWNTFSTDTNSVSGAFFYGVTAQKLGSAVHDGSSPAYIKQGSLVKFINGGWAYVANISGDGDGQQSTGTVSSGIGAVNINGLIKSGDLVQTIVSAWRTNFNNDEVNNISTLINRKQTFGIGYNHLSSTWYTITNDNLSNSSLFSLDNANDISSASKDASWLIKMVYTGTSWSIYIRSFKYIFESVNDVRFYFTNTNKVIDVTTGHAKQDYINVLGINTKPNSIDPFGKDYIWKIKGQYIYPDGYLEPRSVNVTFWDSKVTGVPDNPDEFIEVVNPEVGVDKLLFWKEYTSSDGYDYYQPITISTDLIFQTSADIITSALSDGDVLYVIDSNKFWMWKNLSLVDVTEDYKVRVGRNNINYLWKHYASYNQRINPAVSNIIDMFVLTSQYDTDLRNWISINGPAGTKPVPPTTDQLLTMFQEFESYKMMTDMIVWHPVKYKLLFGQQADPAYQVRFKVVKVPGASVSDTEIKSRVVIIINQYFALSNWDFGSSFFFTELAAYIHSQLATIVGSVVIVPLTGGSKFGDLFEISADPDEIFISCARVSDIDIVQALSDTSLGITNG